MKLFNDKIEKAVAKVKEELAIKYNLSISDIDMIMKKKITLYQKKKKK